MVLFRLSALTVALVAFVGSFAAAVDIDICHLTNPGDPLRGELPVFDSRAVSNSEYRALYPGEDDAGMFGFCHDFLGELCDDNEPCTVDYDYETEKCLEFPRDEVSECEKNF